MNAAHFTATASTLILRSALRCVDRDFLEQHAAFLRAAGRHEESAVQLRKRAALQDELLAEDEKE